MEYAKNRLHGMFQKLRRANCFKSDMPTGLGCCPTVALLRMNSFLEA